MPASSFHYIFIVSFHLLGEMPTKADEALLPMGLLSVFPSPKWATDL